MINNKPLEFSKILDQVAMYAHSSLATKRVLDLTAYKDLDELHDEIKRTNEAMDIARLLGRLPINAMDDISGAIKLAKTDAILSPEELYAIYHVLDNVSHLKSYFASYEGEIVALRDYVTTLEGDEHLKSEIERCILPDFSIADDASAALLKIRKSMRSLTSSIRKTMESYLKTSGDALSLDNLTSRNDRLVLAVKSDHRSEIKGLVHATSASGQTFYIEPERVVTMNNELNDLRADEQEEIRRILKTLSRYVKRIAISLSYDLELVTVLDFIFAKAEYGNFIDGMMPDVVQNGNLSLHQARHPLIDPEKVVANDIILKQKVLMITGSNTGGKTVTLKTAGLLSLMAEAGLPVSATKATIPFFDEIYVDMGDDQSIAESLSTYSSHVKKQIQYLHLASKHSLVLIDEIGSGTDPQEGSALAKAMIDAFIQKGCTLIITTHYGSLKNYGQAHDDIALASVGFNIETMKPTYKLKLDTIGSSYAFEIAENLGMDEAIIKKALAYQQEDENETERLAKKLAIKEAELSEKEEYLTKTLAQAQADKQSYEKKLAGIERQREATLEQAKKASNALLDDAKKMIDEIVKEVREKDNIKDHEVLNAKHMLDDLKHEKKQKVKVQNHTFVVGDHVKIDSMNREGDISEVLKNHQVTVLVSGLAIKLKDTDITFLHPKTKVQKVKSGGRPKMKKTGHYEVNIIGMRYQEAMDTVDKFIDDAIVLGYPSVRIVHGMGTGVLRNGVRKMLKTNKNVKAFRDGGPNEGGLGATVVDLE
ncbi:DNA mismatch repair protein MutS2 [Sharpea azabuensis]|uniref:endonuclease MutS2 n=1 Tax=Sharpea azabuensis TaxID=322505 RepID=UPI0008E87403|nr:endonuclease MutS2 [Sharpea azabuensis]SFE36073.1 DNA mismatch repair protein MutS2 [Sharpea azabuensis]SFL15592.1 DNA mismatch repair protein MutS2 [Sharpea azabuensis]